MERFNEFITEKTVEEIPLTDLHIYILGLGADEGTFAELMAKVAKKKNVKHDLIDVDEAYITSRDVEKGSVIVRGDDDKEYNMSIHNSIVFVRAGAIKSLTAQALISSLQ